MRITYKGNDPGGSFLNFVVFIWLTVAVGPLWLGLLLLIVSLWINKIFVNRQNSKSYFGGSIT